MRKFNYLKGFIPIATAGVGGYITYQASNKDTINKLEIAKIANQTELLKIESNERIKLQELVIKHKELDFKIKELDFKYPSPNCTPNTIAPPSVQYDQPEGSAPLFRGEAGGPSSTLPPLNLGSLTSETNTGELITNGGADPDPLRAAGEIIINPIENGGEALLRCLSPVNDYIENLTREQLLGLSFLLYIGVIIWCFSWIIVYSYLSRKTVDWGEKYGNNQFILLIMNIIRYSSVGLGYIYICTIFLCLGLSGGLACYIFING